MSSQGTLKVGRGSADASHMEPVSGSTATVALYEALTARRANSQQKVDGSNALRLIEGAHIAPSTSGPRPLPPDATISIRV